MKARKVFALLIVVTLFLTIQSSTSLFAFFENNSQNEQCEFTTSAPTGLQWEMTFGGVEVDYGKSIVEIPGEGFAVAGYTSSFGAGDSDAWLVFIDDNGNVLNNFTYGTLDYEHASELVKVSSGGYALAGSQGLGSSRDFWLVRTDDFGGEMWSFPYGTGQEDSANAIIETSDGCFLMVGDSGNDARLVKVNATTGIELWGYNYGVASYPQYGSDVLETADGYVVVGGTDWGSGGGLDLWMFKVNLAGAIQWNYTFGSTGLDFGGAITHSTTGGFVATGTYTQADGFEDFWMVFTDSSGNEVSNHTFGSTMNERAYSISPTRDNDGYVMTGFTDSYGEGIPDFYSVRTDVSGNLVWDLWNGTSLSDTASEITYLSDGGFAIVGNTHMGSGNYDLRMNRLWYDNEGPEFTNLPFDLFFYRTEQASYQVHYTEYSGIRNWWLNDSNFAVTPYGFVYNATTLDVGTYVVQVNAMDKYYNPTSGYGTFTIGDESTTPTTTSTTTTTTPTTSTQTSPTTNATAPTTPEVVITAIFVGGTIAGLIAGVHWIYKAKKVRVDGTKK